ncbi:MAG TPA: alpha/beta hydrolase [Planctomycetota bacterium]|nr:alpha/beta hydrolase [Planctomycetota bacterium]
MESTSVPTEKKSALGAAVKKGAFRALRIAGITTIVAVIGIMIFENKLIYFPSVGGVGPSPGQDVELTAADGVKIHGWYLPHPQAKATILHLHGNAGNLEDRRDLVKDLQGLGVNVLAIDYRGYGRSVGSPGEKGLYADARAAYDWLLTKTTADKIVIHGESLGGGPACELASTVACGALILQSTFTSIPDMAPRVVPIMPKFLVRTKFDNLEKVRRIPCRKLFLHSRGDEVIPFDMGEKLFAAAAEPKESTWFTQAGHNDVTVSQPKKYYSRLAAFLEPFGK